MPGHPCWNMIIALALGNFLDLRFLLAGVWACVGNFTTSNEGS